MKTATQDTSLFDHLDQPVQRVTQPRAGHHHRNASSTELNAAKAIASVSGGQRRKVLEAIVNAGWTGITRQEISDFHGILLQSVTGRLKELLDADFVYETRRQRNGRAVIAATVRGTKAIKS